MSQLPISHLSFSPDGKWLVAGGGAINTKRPLHGGDGIVKVWDASSWKLHATWTDGFTDPVAQVFFVSKEVVGVACHKNIPDKPINISPHDGNEFRFWNIVEKKELPSLHLKDSQGRGKDLAYFAPGKVIAYRRIPNRTGIYQVPGLAEKVMLSDKDDLVIPRFSPDGKRVLSEVHRKAMLQLNDAETGNRLARYALDATKDSSNPTEVRSAQFSRNGKMIAAAVFNPGKIYVVSDDLKETLFTNKQETWPEFAEFTPDNEGIAIKKGFDAVEIYSIKSKEVIKVFKGNPEGVNGCCFSADGAWIAIASGHPDKSGKLLPGRVRVFEVKTGKLVAELE